MHANASTTATYPARNTRTIRWTTNITYREQQKPRP
jgi:hypothetical protein